MNRLGSTIKPFLGTRDFYKSALTVMIPVIIQQFVNFLFNAIDSLMVGRLDVDGLAMSAVAVANKPYDIFCGIMFGMTGAAGLMISQYYGANDRKTCQGLFSMQTVIAVGTALIFFAALKTLPDAIMKIFVSDTRTIELGRSYMSVVAYSYFPMAVSTVCINSMRSIGKNKLSMFVGAATMGLNICLNYMLIFGKLGFEPMGVVGAAWGTLVSRLCEMCLYIYLLLRERMYFSADLTAFTALPSAVSKSFGLKALPLIFNEILWNLGTSAYFWCYSSLNEAAIPAITIAEQCQMLSAVLSMGSASAVAVLIGTELGAGRLAEAKANSKKLITLVLVISLLSSLACFILGLTLPSAYSVSGELRSLATRVALIISLTMPLRFVYAYCFFCLRAGGDTREAMLLDSGYMWALPVPISLLMGIFLPGRITIELAALIINLLMHSKVFWALKVLKRGKWLRNLTSELGSADSSIAKKQEAAESSANN